MKPLALELPSDRNRARESIGEEAQVHRNRDSRCQASAPGLERGQGALTVGTLKGFVGQGMHEAKPCAMSERGREDGGMTSRQVDECGQSQPFSRNMSVLPWGPQGEQLAGKDGYAGWMHLAL